MHKTSARFWSGFNNLPFTVQSLARKNFKILKENPQHPSLHFKKVGKLWSARVSNNYRAVAVQDGSDFNWVWIGSHREYEKLIS